MAQTPSTRWIIQSDALRNLARYLQESPKRYSQAFILSSPSIFNLYGSLVEQQFSQLGIPKTVFLVPEGESSKDLEHVQRCWLTMSQQGVDRQSLAVALGGGAISDLCGFVSSCYMRGIDTLYLPTTLLSMVDASLGGKTGINFAGQKNLIGTFYLPSWVIIDPVCLQTLPSRELSSGLAEIIKYGIIQDPFLFKDLERHILQVKNGNLAALPSFIERSVTIKNKIVEADPYDQGQRAILNYGHTFGHAIEALTNYTQYTHGEAVAIGMSCAAFCSYQKGWVDISFVARQDALCQQAGLPTHLSSLCLDELIEKMKKDKKGDKGKIHLILPKEIGKVLRVADIESSFIKESLRKKQEYDRHKLQTKH